MDVSVVEIFKASFMLWIYMFGLWSVLFTMLFDTMSVSVISICSLFSIMYFMRVPPPSQTSVECVVGKDPAKNADNGNFLMKVVAHRGAGLDAPENSLIAFKMCAEKACYGVEFDVTLTADNVPIIFHDDTLERLTDSMIEIRKLTWDELSQVDISIKHPLRDKFKVTSIPTLDDTVRQCLMNNQKMFIDIKNDDSRMVKIMLELFKRFPTLECHAVCSSFFPHVIYRIRCCNPNIVCSLAYRPHFFAYSTFSTFGGKGSPRTKNFIKLAVLKFFDVIYTWALPRIIYSFLGISIILLHKDYISGKILNDWRAKGIRVIAWTVNHPLEKQHFSRNLKLTYMTDTLIGESTAHK